MEDKQVQESQKVSRVFIWGSKECDQFYTDDGKSVKKRPFELTFFRDQPPIVKVACGGLHTLLLNNQGKLYSFGCNDEGQLGRPDDSENGIPKLVNLPCGVDLISAGDCHSIAANSQNGILFQWGSFKDKSGDMDKKKKFINSQPTQVGKEQFGKRQLQKVLSGANHVLVLTKDQDLFVWGESDSSVIGRKPLERRKLEQCMRIETIKRKVDDVWTGYYHAFFRTLKKTKQADNVPIYFGWGLNNYGQLGIQSIQNTQIPLEVVALRGKNIIDIQGAEKHTLALEDNGNVLTWGINMNSELGLGENWVNDFSTIIQSQQQRQSQSKKKPKEEEVKQTQFTQEEQKQMTLLEKPDRIEEPIVIKNFFCRKRNDDDELEDIQEPNPNITKVYASMSYNFAVSSNKFPHLYTWGSEVNLLCTGNEEEEKPISISQKVLGDITIGQMSLGGQHAVIIENGDQQILSEYITGVPDELMHKKKTPHTKASRPNRSKSKESESGSQQQGIKRNIKEIDTKDIDKSMKKIKI